MKKVLMNLRVPFLFFLIFFAPALAMSQQVVAPCAGQSLEVPAESAERLKGIYERNEFGVQSFRGNWLPDGSAYLVLETNPVNRQRMIVAYDTRSGRQTELVSDAKLVLPDGTGTFIIQDYTISPDGDRILIQATNSEDTDRGRHYWVFNRPSGKLMPVTAGASSRFSPDGQFILFIRDGNIYVSDISNNRTLSLTNDAVAGSISNSRALWSPDGNRIAFVQSDVSRIPFRSSLVPADPTYPKVRETRFARVGGDIAVLRVGVIDLNSLETLWLPVSVPPEGYYLGEIGWAGNSEELLIEKHSRFRDQRTFLLANVTNGAIDRIYEETDPAWVIASYGINTGLAWVDQYENFIFLSEQDGWRQAFLCSRDGKKMKKIVSGDFDIIERVGVDQAKGLFYFCASPDNGTQKYLFQTSIKQPGPPVRVSPENQSGTHAYALSPDGGWAFHTYSSASNPPVTELVKLPEHKVVRVLEDNQELRDKMQDMEVQPKEFLQVDIGGGTVIDGWMIKPKDFDPTKKYPVFVYVYGEPHGQTVIDSWRHAYTEFHRVIADLGYLVVSFDNRGTPSPKGAAWRRAISGSLGPLSTDEQAAILEEMARMLPYVDLDRVGIWGWSGGGSNTLNAMFRQPDLYDVGIAVAPKPQPHLYNAWFQEIYMKTPEVNPEGYRQSAPIHFAEGLSGNLLIIHGTGETNTHIQITEGLVDRLIELGKPFDYMAYPHRNHGIYEGPGTSLHLRTLIVRYLINHLPAGPLD